VREVSAPPIPLPRVSVVRSAGGILASTVVTLAIGYVASVILARSLGPEGRGQIAVMITDVALVVSLAGLGTPAAITFFASRRSRHQPGLNGFALIFTAALSVVSLAGVLLFGGWLQEHQGGAFDERLWWLVALSIPLMYAEYYVSALLNARHQYSLSNRLNVLGRVGVLVATLSLVTGLHWGVAGGLIATAMISIVKIAGSIPTVQRIGARMPSRHLIGATLNYGWRVCVGQMFRFFSGRFDLLVLSWLASLSTVGTYAVAQMVAELVIIIPQSFGFVILPMIAAGQHERAAPALRLVGTLALLAALGMALAGPAMITLGFGDAFRAALVPFFILLPGVWMLAYGNICAFVLGGKKRPGSSSLLAGAATVLTVILDLALIPPFGAVGAAIAATAASTLFGLASLLLVGRLIGTPAYKLMLVTLGEARNYWNAAMTRLAIARHE
jgi:O-antigen/teichoic acid export membrane protein